MYNYIFQYINASAYIYIYIYVIYNVHVHAHTHTHIYIYIYEPLFVLFIVVFSCTWSVCLLCRLFDDHGLLCFLNSGPSGGGQGTACQAPNP